MSPANFAGGSAAPTTALPSCRWEQNRRPRKVGSDDRAALRNLGLRIPGRGPKFFLAPLLKPKSVFFIFLPPPRGGVLDAETGQGHETGTGRVRCRSYPF